MKFHFSRSGLAPRLRKLPIHFAVLHDHLISLVKCSENILQMRAAGLGISVALTMTEAGRMTMTTQCQHIIGGPWGAAFGVLLDQSEFSLVRQQAVLLLINVTSRELPRFDVTNGFVRNDETGVFVFLKISHGLVLLWLVPIVYRRCRYLRLVSPPCKL